MGGSKAIRNHRCELAQTSGPGQMSEKEGFLRFSVLLPYLNPNSFASSRRCCPLDVVSLMSSRIYCAL